VAVTVEAGQRVALAQLVDARAPAVAVAALEAALRDWIAFRPAGAAVEGLLAHDIAAATVLSGAQVWQQQGRAWDQALQTSPQGAVVKGFPQQFERQPMTISREAPSVGADSDEVLRRVGRLTQEEIEALREQGVI
jgi:crotonobetainyl-CoA:carnitine CoA-transferase CaiB-like acyl-CoA transferase